MLVWVVYDIVEDKVRNKAAKICKNKGLYRVQKSVFLGTLEDNRMDELKIEMEDLIDTEKDSVKLPRVNPNALTAATGIFVKSRLCHYKPK